MKTDELSIMSFNIFNGASDRIDKVLEVIKESNPDICGILEAVNWNEEDISLRKKFLSLGYPFFKVFRANSKYNIAVISKKDVTFSDIKKDIKHVVVCLKIKELDIFFVHLSPISEEERLLELKEIFCHLNKKSKSIIIGDFNSLSYSDVDDYKSLLNSFQLRKIKKFGINVINFDVIKYLENNNFVDSLKILNKPYEFSVPTPFNQDLSHSEKIRIDYAFLSSNLIDDISNFEIIKNDLTDSASDHYPILLKIKR